MITACRAYFIGLLKSVMGEETRVCTTIKELASCAESHVAAVLVGGESLARSGQRLQIKTGSGPKTANRIFRRELQLRVILGEYSFEALEGYYNALLANMAPSLADSSGYDVLLEPGEADWVEEADSLIRAKVAVELNVVCSGGVYRPVQMAIIREAVITAEQETP